jgi:hypothetical protein
VAPVLFPAPRYASPRPGPADPGDTNVFGDMRLIGELCRPDLAPVPSPAALHGKLDARGLRGVTVHDWAPGGSIPG